MPVSEQLTNHSAPYMPPDDAKYAEICAKLKELIRELDPELTDEAVDLALTRVLFYAERERHQANAEPNAKPAPE